jgi:hypothetical protein
VTGALFLATMLGRLTKILAHHTGLREETAILGVGRDLWMLGFGTVLFLSNYWMQVNIEIDHLPSIIVFVR